jgi:hypothetical protein
MMVAAIGGNIDLAQGWRRCAAADFPLTGGSQ